MRPGIDEARQYLHQNRWQDAAQRFADVDRTDPLGPDELVEYAAAMWWKGDVEAATDLLERAHTGFEAAGRRGEAAIVALRLARVAMVEVKPSIMAGWMARAGRHLEGQPESAANAWFSLMSAAATAFGQGDLSGGEELAGEALRLARKHDSPDVESLALAIRGQIVLRQGRWREGVALVEEAAAAATSGRVEPKNSCDVYCLAIAAFADLGEYGRAGEWIDQADRWMRVRSISGYRGLCRVHRAELKRMRGDWREAEEEALEACSELQRFRMLDSVGFAYYQIGEVRLRLGDIGRAEEAFQQAVSHGHPGQPGLALLALATGRHGEAASMLAASLSQSDGGFQANDLISRAGLLAAQVEVALAGDEGGVAKDAVAELSTIAAKYDCDAISGLMKTAAGATALHADDLVAATAALRSAAQHWRRANVPYEWARARALLGDALARAGDVTTARMELQAAISEFERLGAAPDASYAHDLLRRLDGDSRPRPVTRTFMFTDIVGSTDLAGTLGDATWQSMMAWHDRTLRRSFADHGGVEVRHTGDGFFVTFEDPRAALKCAVEVQRLLERNRLEHGSALSVRIGMHVAEALPHEKDFAGQGVHVAARVAALAGRGEILATQAVIEESGEVAHGVSEPRTATLKGVTEPVTVLSIDWR